MAEENPSDGDAITKQDTAPNSHSAVSVGSKEYQQDTSKSKEGGTKTVSHYKFFSFADSMDYLLMSVGTISGIGNGLCMPLMTKVMGDVINSFGETRNNKEVADAVSKVALKFIYLALGAAAASFLRTLRSLLKYYLSSH